MEIKKQLISSTPYCFGRNNQKRWITVHQTGNMGKGADAQAHANLQSNGNTRDASWHWTVDDKRAIQSFSHDFQLWAAGDGRGNGNLNSIHIEICINSDGDYNKAVKNGAELVKRIMKQEGISINNVVRHYDWSGKICPQQIMENKNGISWTDFKNMVQNQSTPTATPKPTPKPSTQNSGGWTTENATFTIGVDAINLRTDTNPNAKLIATLKRGQQVKYNAWKIVNGYLWIRQPRGNGYGYLATGPANGKGRTAAAWGTFK